MEIFKIINCLYITKSPKWILDLDDSDIQPLMIQKFLMMNGALIQKIKDLNQYAFTIPAKQYLALAWAVIPKVDKAPWVQYIKKNDIAIDNRFQKLLGLSDNDWNESKSIYLDYLKNNKLYLGVKHD